ncbi:MAG: Gfo/Idh/MocA family oxidoreductase [Salinivirgaceae bacterium]|nr:Gfo/Idh/MocA family oxidoreductase [Salinivirgaceae bacterium]
MNKNIFRRDFLKGMTTVPFLGYFGFAFHDNVAKGLSSKSSDYREILKIGQIVAPRQKLLPSTGSYGKSIRIGLVGNGWRGEDLLRWLGYVHPDFVEQNTINGKPSKKLQDFLSLEDLNVEITGICDTFSVHTQRGVEISMNDTHSQGRGTKLAKVFASYRDMVASDEIDAIIIATSDHMHVPIAIAAAKAGKHVYLEKPMAHSIEEAIALKKTIRGTGIVFQLGHNNRQQMSYKVARELYLKGVMGNVTMVQTYTNRNTRFGVWIRDEAFDHLQGNKDNIDWKEFLGTAPWHEFDLKRYFSWQRFSEYGTGTLGNDFSHKYDCVNQVLGLGIPESVIAIGGQHYHKTHGDMPDILNAVFYYPERGLTMTYDCSLKNEIYRPARILGSEASMDIDRTIMMYKDSYSERYKEIKAGDSEPLFYYEPTANIDAVSSATSKAYMKGGFGPTFIDGKVADVTFLHVKEWVDAIRGQGKPSCGIDEGFEEAVTFNLANLAYVHKKMVRWDPVTEKAIIG